MTISAPEFQEVFVALGLGSDYVAPLVAAMETRACRPGERLVTRGERSDTLYFIVRGEVDVSIDVDGRPLELGRIGAGRWVGEFGLIDPAPASATVVAVGGVELLALDHAALERLHGQCPEAASDLLVRLSLDLAHRLRQTGRQQLVADGNGYAVRGADDSASRPLGPFARLGRLLGIGGAQ